MRLLLLVWRDMNDKLFFAYWTGNFLIFFTCVFFLRHVIEILKHMGFPLICLISATRWVTWLQSFLQLYRWRRGNDSLAEKIQRVSGLNQELWPALGNEWANKMTDSTPPRPSLIFRPFLSPSISVEALNLSQWLPDSIIICLNWIIMRLVNLILSQNQINPYDGMHMCICATVLVWGWAHCVCWCVYAVCACQDP